MTATRLVMSPPGGSRDLLPPQAARRRQLVADLLGAFSQWGYRQVVTPMVERFDVLSAGMSSADTKAVVRFIAAHTGDVVALRSDITPQIARMVAEHRGASWAGRGVLRLSYAADVVRQPAEEREQTEYHQVGVELVGDADPAADAELVALGHAALRRVGLTGFRFDLSHGGVAHGTLDALGLDAGARAEVAALLARKDRGGAEAFVIAQGIEPARAATVGALCDLYGDPGALERARTLLTAPAAQAGLDALEGMLSHLREVHPDAADSVDVDLGEVRGFDYYTGPRIRVWAPGEARPILRGGRYDDLIGRYGDAAPATGFALDLDALERALGVRPEHLRPAVARLVALAPGCPPQARIEANKRAAAARGAGEGASVQPELELEQAQALAVELGVAALSFLSAPGPDGPIGVRCFRRTAQVWTEE